MGLKAHSKTLDFLLAAVISQQQGKFKQAAFALEQAAASHDADVTVAGLNASNEKLFDQAHPSMARLLEEAAGKKKLPPAFLKNKMKKAKAAKSMGQRLRKVRADVDDYDGDEGRAIDGHTEAPAPTTLDGFGDTDGFDLTVDVDPSVRSEMNLDDLQLDEDGDMTTDLPSDDDNIVELPVAEVEEAADGDEDDDVDNDDDENGDDDKDDKDDKKEEAAKKKLPPSFLKNIKKKTKAAADDDESNDDDDDEGDDKDEETAAGKVGNHTMSRKIDAKRRGMKANKVKVKASDDDKGDDDGEDKKYGDKNGNEDQAETDSKDKKEDNDKVSKETSAARKNIFRRAQMNLAAVRARDARMVRK